MSYFLTKNFILLEKSHLLCVLFCNLYDETLYIFHERDRLKCLWSNLVQCFQNNLILPTLTRQTAIFGFLDYTNNDSIFENNKCLSNHILLIFKLYVYKSREKKLININNLIAEIRKGKRIEKEIALTISKKIITFTKKCRIINNIVP